ncbi:hypothetical protein [Melioribacter sp. OK-6-Me]|uniref:hypothetical protein n=1 Tax=unclassified Melioribacter TaxID=2627329 RepID=UPI003ED92256
MCRTANAAEAEDCAKCGESLEGARAAERREITAAKRIFSSEIAIWLKAMGWIYFALSFIGGFVLIGRAFEWVYNGERFERILNPALFSMGVASVITSVIVLLICLGIARVIEQNISLYKQTGRALKD